MLKYLPHLLVIHGLLFITTFATATDVTDTDADSHWYKGNLHMHSFWSDGNLFPEMAIDWYKDHGFHFVSLTDHSLLQNRPNNWRTIGEEGISQLIFDQYVEKYGNDWVETRENEGKPEVRLKMFDEFIDKLNEPGRFLVIPGHEQNLYDKFPIRRQGQYIPVPDNGQNADNYTRAVHDNVINVVDTQPFQLGPTVADCFRFNVEYLTQYGIDTGRDVLLIANHPHWVYFDIYPQDYIDVPELRFYEFLNCNPVHKPHPQFWSIEKFWDIVNSFRIEDGLLPLYGVANDDTHDYLQTGSKTTDLNNYWSVVRATELTAEKIIRAMYQGDFYCSSGLELETLHFDSETKTLSVAVKPEEGVNYTIRFNGTKKQFDRSITEVEAPETGKKPARTIPVYSDQIGEIFQESLSTSASYRMTGDDLFVRVTVVSDKETTYIDSSGYEPLWQSAWSQPYLP